MSLHVKLGGGLVSKATKVSFFASGPFPTCYQMSWSSTTKASKSRSSRAATGATNVRKSNPSAPAGRFQPKQQTDGASNKLLRSSFFFFSLMFKLFYCVLINLNQLLEVRRIPIFSGSLQEFA